MARKLLSAELGFAIHAENGSDPLIYIISGTAVPDGTSDDQGDAPIGSLYARSGTGELYQKILNNGNAGDYELNGASAAIIGNWRPETVAVLTNEVQGAGTRDMVASPFSDDDGTPVAVSEFVVGKYVISGASGTPVLLEITAVVGDDVTFALATPALAEDDTFVVNHYLPNPDGLETTAIVNFNGSIMLKLADVSWNFANGINIASGYTAANGTITTSDSVQSAIEKLDGNQQDIQSASGIAQGDIDYGTFTGNSFADNQDAKELYQRIEILLEQLRGVRVAGLTTLATVDEVPVAVGAVKWLVHAFVDATPANMQAFEIYAANNGTLVDDTTYAKLKQGSNFNLNSVVDISGGNMRLRFSSTTAGVTITARRIEVVQSVL